MTPPSCPLCQDKHFLVYDVAPGDPRFGQRVPCTCTQAGQLAALRAALSRGKYAAMRLDTFNAWTPAEKAALRIAKHTAKRWQEGAAASLILWSPLVNTMLPVPGQPHALHVTGAGCGKTHLAVALAAAALDAGRTAGLRTESELIETIRGTYSPGASRNTETVLAELAGLWLLALDDIGTAHVRDESLSWYQDILFQLLNDRYTANRPVVLTTNLAPEALTARIGPRLSSRLAEMAETVRLDGPDRREIKR